MKKLFPFLLLLPLFTKAQIINTFAGSAAYTTSGDGGPAIDAGIYWPRGIAFDHKGNMYFVDNNTVRKVDAAGIVTTIAGDGIPGFSGDSSLAVAAKLNDPQGMAIDKAGNLYIAEQNNHVVRKVDTNGIITTFAGNYYYSGGYGAYWGPADSAGLAWPTGLAFDTSGNLYIADMAGNINIVNIATDSIMSILYNIHDTLFTLGISDITGVVVDNNGDIYFTGESNSAVYKISTGGVNLAANYGLIDSGTVHIVAGSGGTSGSSGDGGPATAALLTFPYTLALDKYHNLYIADGDVTRIRVVDTSGIIHTIAGDGTMGFSGDGGSALLAEMDNIGSGEAFISLDTAGNLYISDNGNNRIRKVTAPMSAITLHSNAPGVAENRIMIYPDPATTQLTVRSTNDLIHEMTITNVLGQKIQPAVHCSQYSITVDVSEWPDGVYFVCVNNTEVSKFVKK